MKQIAIVFLVALAASSCSRSGDPQGSTVVKSAIPAQSVSDDVYAKTIRDFVRSNNQDQRVIGKSEQDLKEMFGRVNPVDGSFSILVSKNLHPYHPPDSHRLLRLDDTYTVFELKENKVIKVHRVSG